MRKSYAKLTILMIITWPTVMTRVGMVFTSMYLPRWVETGLFTNV